MTDEDKKRIVSEPPPPTDEIDGEWGDDDQTLVRGVPEGVSKSVPAPSSVGNTAVAPISVPPKAAVSSTPPKAAASSTPPKAAASSTPPKAAEASTPPEMKAAAPVASTEEDDEEEDDEEEDDEESTENEDDAADEEAADEEDEEEDDEDDEHVAAPAGAATASADWLPDWAPFAVLAALVGVSIVFGLGLVGGPDAPVEENEAVAEPAASVKAPVKANPHP